MTYIQSLQQCQAAVALYIIHAILINAIGIGLLEMS